MIAYSAAMGGYSIVNELVALPPVYDGGVALMNAIDRAVQRAGSEYGPNPREQSAGWRRVAPYSNGWEYRIVSPQGYKCRCRMWSTFGSYVQLQMRSEDGARVGETYYLRCVSTPPLDGQAPTPYLQLWANCSTLFVSAPHQSSGYQYPSQPGSEQTYTRTFQGGIPYSATAQSEIWWASGNSFSSGSGGLRYTIYRPPYYDACCDGQLRSASGADYDPGAFTLGFPAAPRIDSGNGGKYFSEGLLWWDGRPVTADPLMAWGDPGSTTVAKVRGQLWDSAIVMRTSDAIDDIAQWPNPDNDPDLLPLNWRVYSVNHSGLLKWGWTGELWLLMEPPFRDAVEGELYSAY